MKLTAILLTAVCINAAATGNTQGITLNEKNAPLQKIFKEIHKQTGYQFFYKDELLDKAGKVDVVVKNVSLEEALKICFMGLRISYKIIDKTIVVTPTPVVQSGGHSLVSDPAPPDLGPPPIDIRGRVVNEKGEPVIATITVKGTKKATSTNSNGEFQLTGIDENAVLIITATNIETREISVASNPGLKSGDGKSGVSEPFTITVKMKETEMQEVIINKGYYTEKQKLSVSNVGRVTAKEIEKQPVSNPLLALEGRIPGLFITQSNGLPGSGVTVRIQGQNSISKGNDPLYIVDGVPISSQLMPTAASILGSSGGIVLNGVPSGSGNPLSYINPADIESIEVLKDGNATAIYGSRAANGAILITTKKGKPGQTKVDINVQQGIGQITRKMDLLNTQQYISIRKEAKRNDNVAVSLTDYDINGIWDSTKYTDWQKELIGGKANYTDIQARISGGNNLTQFLVGAGFHRETTVFPGDLADSKGSLYFNIHNISINQKLRFKLSGSYMLDNNELQSRDLTGVALQLAPNAPTIYNADGSLNWAPVVSGSSSVSTWTNPLSYLYNKYKNRSINLMGNSIISYQFLPGFEIKSSFGYNRIQSNENSISPLTSIAPELRPTSSRTATYANGTASTWIIEPQISYYGKVGAGELNILIGSTFQNVNSNRQELRGSGYNSDLVLEDIKAASTLSINSTLISTYKYNAIFGRINYNLKDKYLIDLNGRRDGSSRFGSENLFHNFGSIGAAWIFSKEKLIQESLGFLSFGKIKVSYGAAGNDQIGDYQFMNLYSIPTGVTVAYGGGTSLEPIGLPNPYLQWEETKKLQIGLDVGLFQERILISITNFQNTSSNQLLTYSLPRTTGFSIISAYNFPAKVKNSGWEFSLHTLNAKGKSFKWESNFNLTIPKNKLTSFENISTSSYASILTIGKPITALKVYHFAGVDPSTGIYLVGDKNGNSVFTPNTSTDKIALVDRAPKFFGGLENEVTYKNISLSFLFQFVKQIAPNLAFGNFPGFSNLNQPVYVLDRWQKPGDITSVQRYTSGANGSVLLANLNATGSDAAYSDASYIRLKNLSLSWNLLEQRNKRLGLQSCRLFLQGQNLITITKYKGLDPESKSFTSLPPLRVMTMGVQFGL